MCARYTLKHTTDQVALRFEVDNIIANLSANYKVLPTQEVAVVTINSPRSLDLYRWGLVPPWAKDPSIGKGMINARAETLPEKPSFRQPLAKKRCIIPADGFYEWRANPEGNGKQPMYIKRRDGGLFAFAGLWEEWHYPDGSPLRTCTVITTSPNDLIKGIHDRMPAILLKEDEAAWLDKSSGVSEVLSLLRSYPDEEMEAYPVSNRPDTNGPECIESITEDT